MVEIMRKPPLVGTLFLVGLQYSRSKTTRSSISPPNIETGKEHSPSKRGLKNSPPDRSTTRAARRILTRFGLSSHRARKGQLGIGAQLGEMFNGSEIQTFHGFIDYKLHAVSTPYMKYYRKYFHENNIHGLKTMPGQTWSLFFFSIENFRTWHFEQLWIFFSTHRWAVVEYRSREESKFIGHPDSSLI